MSRFQLFAFILQTQIGIGVLTFPYDLHKAAGADGWISILLAGVVIQLILLAYVVLAQRFPKKNLYEFAPLILGKWGGRVITLFYVFHFVFTSCIILLLEIMFVELWILPNSNPLLIILANVVVLGFFARQSIRIIARYHTIILFLIILMFVLLFVGSDQSEYRYLLPVGQMGWLAILSGMKSAIISFLGFELLLVVSSDVQTSGKSLVTPLLWSNIVITIFYMTAVLVCYLYFSPQVLDRTPQPVPFYLSGISLPFLERLDLIFLSIWLVKVTSTLTGYFYGAAKGMGFLFHRNKHDSAVLYLVPLVCATGFFWNSENDILSLTKVLQVESYFVVGLPILLLILAMLLGRKEVNQA